MARSGIEVQIASVKALFFREIKTRFGKFHLGYLWAIIEPISHLLILLVIFGYVLHRTMPSISFPVFLVNGIIPFIVFSNITKRSIGAIEANRNLFNYRPIKPIDTVISRALLEMYIYICVYMVVTFIIWLYGESFEIVKPLLLLSVWALLSIFSFSIGLIFMVIGNNFKEMQKVIPILMKPLYFISCVMIPLHVIPRQYWIYFLWNPLVHIIELSREAVIPGYICDGASLNYLFIFCLISLFIALGVYKITEEKMLTS